MLSIDERLLHVSKTKQWRALSLSCVFILFFLKNETKVHDDDEGGEGGGTTPENVHVAHTHTHTHTEWSAHVASSVTNGIRRDDPDFETINFTSAVTAADAHLCVCMGLSLCRL